MRKRFPKVLLYLFILTIIKSCTSSKNDVLPISPNIDHYDVSFNVSDQETRVVDNVFEAGDQIIVDAYNSTGEIFADDVLYQYSNGKFYASETPIKYEDDQQSLIFDLVYPKLTTLSKNFNHDIQTQQGTLSMLENSDLLVANCTATLNESRNLKFAHKMSSVIINITSANDPTSVKVLGQTSVSCDLTNNSFEGVGERASITPYHIGNGRYKVVVAPSNLADGELFITAIVDGESYEWRADGDVLFEPGKEYSISWKVGTIPPGTGGTKYSWWAELPEEDPSKAGDYYYVYHMRKDNSKVRNFAACYSKDLMSPVWVAAPMHSSYLLSGNRTDAYAHDPQLDFNQAGSWGSPYNRGHLLKSSARTITRETNTQAFYYSNIAPQFISGFNTGGGVWNNLEDYENTQICSDTLYTVHGAHWTDTNDRVQGSYAATPTAIPTHFFKVFLRTKSGNTGKAVWDCSSSELKCVAFYIEHNTSQHGKKPSAEMMMSVSELEQITGHTFFSNVPNAPKDSFSASEWGL